MLNENALFYGALLAVAIMGLIELVALLVVGAGISDAAHALFHTGDTDGAPLPDGLNWLMVRDLPLMVVVVLLLSGFGLAGLAVRLGANHFGYDVAMTAAIGVGVVGGLVALRVGGRLIAPLFKLHTTVVSRESLIGCTAILHGASATTQRAGEARVVDRFGAAHYFQVVPERDGDELRDGQEIVLTQIDGHRFKAVSKD